MGWIFLIFAVLFAGEVAWFWLKKKSGLALLAGAFVLLSLLIYVLLLYQPL